MVDGDTNYDKLDVHTLTNILLNPDNKSDTHLAALSAITRIDSFDRTSRLIQVMNNIVNYAGRYDQDVMEQVIDVLATDPHPDATLAMIEALPGVLDHGVSGENELNPDFREYYYNALLTRQRPEDLDVWGEMLPELETQTLMASMFDPVAGSIVDAIDPLELLDRKPEPERTKAYLNLANTIIKQRGNTYYLQEAVKALRRSHDEAVMEEAVEDYMEWWATAKQENDKAIVNILEKILGLFDKRPRTTAEKLMGKRPWAS